MLTGVFGFRLNARFLIDPIGQRLLMTLFEEVRPVYKHLLRALVTIPGLLLFISMAHGQSAILDLPRGSQHAVVSSASESLTLPSTIIGRWLTSARYGAGWCPMETCGGQAPTKIPPLHSAIRSASRERHCHGEPMDFT